MYRILVKQTNFLNVGPPLGLINNRKKEHYHTSAVRLSNITALLPPPPQSRTYK
jgi:hypothetical protein